MPANYLYCSHPGDTHGHLIALPLAIAQQNSAGWFGESYTGVGCAGGARLVFAQCGPLPISFLVASDEGETEGALRALLELLHRLLLLEFGPQALYSATKIKNGFFHAPHWQRRFQALTSALTTLAEQRLSFLVHALEHLLLPSASKELKEELQTCLRAAAPERTVHSLLCVGTKLAALHAPPKSAPLDPLDQLLLIIHFWSCFHTAPPVVPEEEKEERFESATQTEEDSSVTDGFVSADEELDMDVVLALDEALHSTPPAALETEWLESCSRRLGQEQPLVEGEVNRLVELLQVPFLPHSRSSHQIVMGVFGMYGGAVDGVLSPLMTRALRKQVGERLGVREVLNLLHSLAEQLDLDALAQEPAPAGTTLLPVIGFHVLSILVKSERAEQSSSSEGSRLSRSLSASGYTTPTLAPPPRPSQSVSPSPLSSSLPSGVSGSGARKPRRRKVERAQSLPVPSARPGRHVYRKLFLRQVPSGGDVESSTYAPFWVVMAQLALPGGLADSASPMTAIYVMRDQWAADDEKRELQRIEQQLGETLVTNYADYLLSVESTYSMISYLPKFPGLVQFLLVDRSENRLHAPAITPLVAPDAPLASSNPATLLQRERIVAHLKVRPHPSSCSLYLVGIRVGLVPTGPPPLSSLFHLTPFRPKNGSAGAMLACL